MAIALAFRLAIVMAPAVYRLSRLLETQPGKTFVLHEAWKRAMADSGLSDAEVENQISAESGSVVRVTTFTGDFETKKLHMIWGRTSGGALPEDDVLTTWHFLKVAGGVPIDIWEDPDFVDIENEVKAMWATMDQYYTDQIRLRQLRWYKQGPQIDDALGGRSRTGEPIRIIDLNLPGTSTGVACLPPQVACSVTEITTSRKHWGRSYWPAPMAAETAFNTVNHVGRWATPFITALADSYNAMYDHLVAVGRIPVVYSGSKPARTTAGGAPLPAQPAAAYSIETIQIDDIPDVIRSRRYDAPLLRLQRAIG